MFVFFSGHDHSAGFAEVKKNMFGFIVTQIP